MNLPILCRRSLPSTLESVAPGLVSLLHGKGVSQHVFVVSWPLLLATPISSFELGDRTNLAFWTANRVHVCASLKNAAVRGRRGGFLKRRCSYGAHALPGALGPRGQRGIKLGPTQSVSPLRSHLEGTFGAQSTQRLLGACMNAKSGTMSFKRACLHACLV